MSTPLRLAVLGLSHDHVWDVLPSAADAENVRIAAAADPHPELQEKFEREYSCPTYDDHAKLLESEAADAVLVYSDNRTSVALAETAVERGLHVLIEKPLAADLDDAERLVAAAHRCGVQVMVNWPFAWWPQLRRGLELALQGEIGRLWQVKYRAAHAGPAQVGCSKHFCRWLYDPQLNGGGAYVDYCCYGALLARVLLGMPQGVCASLGRLVHEQCAAEDNGVLLMSYAQASAISEASWSQVGKLSSYIATIYSAEGSLLVEPRAGGRLLLADRDDPEGREVTVAPLSPEQAGPIPHFAHGIRTGDPFTALCTLEAARDVQAILQAGLEFAEKVTAVTPHAH